MKTSFFVFLLITLNNLLYGQYKLTPKFAIECTNVKNQQRTGTCWSFATSSFLESEVKRLKNIDVDLSEMFSVRTTYIDKAQNYILRQGKANFSEGSLSHDVINAVQRVGLVPESVFSGKTDGETIHNHSEMVAACKGMLNGLQKQKTLSPKWKKALTSILDVYLGKAPDKFNYEGKEYSPKSFAAFLDIKPKNYTSYTSYTHHPFYEKFVLEIPDNYSNGIYQNIPIDELEAVLDYAIANGYSVAWDGDVSEKTFNHSEGLAILPADKERNDLWDRPGAEIKVTQNLRQETFESKSTTDDHLMHIVGIAFDNKGTKYYKVKNSWGTSNVFKGYLYMSEAYFKLKTVAILLHNDAIPKKIAKKLK
ncbi:MAG: C1 family peptidase [Saprospiraceae bacterium]|nr:C1 family peptidase [Saprospiraceae bacterium]